MCMVEQTLMGVSRMSAVTGTIKQSDRIQNHSHEYISYVVWNFKRLIYSWIKSTQGQYPHEPSVHGGISPQYTRTVFTQVQCTREYKIRNIQRKNYIWSNSAGHVAFTVYYCTIRTYLTINFSSLIIFFGYIGFANILKSFESQGQKSHQDSQL